MGELDEMPFVLACKERYGEDAEIKAAELCSLWQEHVKDPNWHPFKMLITGSTAQVLQWMHIFYLPLNFLEILSKIKFPPTVVI